MCWMKLILCSILYYYKCNIWGYITNEICAKKLFLAQLGVCPWKYQPVALYAISPISMELGQFKGCTLKLKQANWFLFWLFPWIERLLYRFFLVFTKEIASKWGKCMKLSLRWYLTYYSEGLHRYCYILDKSTT